MLQVGVDVSRFGLMVVTGQPKNTAEYIQASSRVGRDASRPGLVVTLYNWSRPRDLAHYEDFEHYHATFYRQVEALSVTPFTRRVARPRHGRDASSPPCATRRTRYSRNRDAHDVAARRPGGRADRRAAAAPGPRRSAATRGRELPARSGIERLKDVWNAARRPASARLGYRGHAQGQPAAASGCCDRAGDGRWDRPDGRAVDARDRERDQPAACPADRSVDPPYGAPDVDVRAADAGDADADDGPARRRRARATPTLTGEGRADERQPLPRGSAPSGPAT